MTVTRIVTLDSSGEQICDDCYEDPDIGSLRKHYFDDPYERLWHQRGGQKCDDSHEDRGLRTTRIAREPQSDDSYEDRDMGFIRGAKM